jgi:hypothetical protein
MPDHCGLSRAFASGLSWGGGRRGKAVVALRDIKGTQVALVGKGRTARIAHGMTEF